MTQSEPTPQRGNLWLGVAMGVAAGLVIVVLAWFALVDPTTAEPAPPTAPQTPAQTPTQEPSPTPSPTRTPSPTPTATTEPSATPEPTETTQAPTTHPDIVTELPAGSWVTVLQSLRQSDTTAEQAVARANEWSRPEHKAVALDSNAFSGSLSPGLFPIVVPGASSAQEALAVCHDFGIDDRNKCYPRQIKG